MDLTQTLLSGEAPLRKSFRAAVTPVVLLKQQLTLALHALRKQASFASTLSSSQALLSPPHTPPPSLLTGLMGGLHLPALSWLLLGGKEAHPDGFQQFS